MENKRKRRAYTGSLVFLAIWFSFMTFFAVFLDPARPVYPFIIFSGVAAGCFIHAAYKRLKEEGVFK